MSKAITNNAEIIRKCWNDPEFKKQFLAEPKETLKSIGVTIEEGVDVKVLEDTDTLVHFVIPPQSANLNDEDLSSVAGGGAYTGGAYTGGAYTGGAYTGGAYTGSSNAEGAKTGSPRTGYAY